MWASWLCRYIWNVEIVGSNPTILISLFYYNGSKPDLYSGNVGSIPTKSLNGLSNTACYIA